MIENEAMMITVLLLSAGTRNKVVQYFKKSLEGIGRVIATDCSELAPAIHEADKYYIVPRIDAPDYLQMILNICKEESVDGVLSLIDPELSLIAEHKQDFLEIGCTPIVSEAEQVELCFDKYKMFSFLKEHGFHTAKSYQDLATFQKDLASGDITFPVFVKPIKGSASININKVNSVREVELLFDLYDDLMIQEYMNGTEFGADVYIDMISGEIISIFTKEKIKMRAGETDKAVSVKDEKLFNVIQNFVKTAGFRGMIDIDLFLVNGEYYISEVNPRFGGGYPHAFACGVNTPQLIVNNLSGNKNTPAIGAYKEGIYMMKYNEIMIKDGIG